MLLFPNNKQTKRCLPALAITPFEPCGPCASPELPTPLLPPGLRLSDSPTPEVHYHRDIDLPRWALLATL